MAKKKTDEDPIEELDEMDDLDSDDNDLGPDLDAGADDIPADAIDVAATTPSDAPPPDATGDIPAAPVKVNGPDMFEQLVALLNQAGLQLPAHVNKDNIIEQLVTALTTAIAMGAKFERADADDEEAVPQAAATSGDMGGAPAPEPPPMMMATIAKWAPEKLAKYGLARMRPTMLSTDEFSDRERVWAEKESERVRKKVGAAWRFCRDKLGLFPDIADREAGKVSQIQLSFLPNGEAVKPADLATVLIVKEILTRIGGINPDNVDQTRVNATLATAKAIPNPAAKADKNKAGNGGGREFATRMLRKATGNDKAELAEVR